MISADTKTDLKQEIKELVADLATFHRSNFPKLEIQCKTGLHFLYFSFNLGWHLEQGVGGRGGVRRFFLNGQNLLASVKSV